MNAVMLGSGLQSPVPSAAPGLGSRVLGRLGLESPYRVRVSRADADIKAAQALRFFVFNLELNEGLESSYTTLRDEDRFDPICDHVIVESVNSGEVVGTYRLQTGRTAAVNLGYYSALEFDFTPFEPYREQIIELGRACVHRDHRNLAVLGLLWRGIADYARAHGVHYFLGCSSLTSQDASEGAAAFFELSSTHLVEPSLRTFPLPEFRCDMEHLAPIAPKIPKLLRAYLSLGAKICGPPAIDREFKTIDFLTWLDIDALPASARRVIG
jgi:putative hemolysin